jgi:2-oxoglutarate/2-oxoacid ferredoxin oxidoreductase subunit alpha
MSSQTPPDQAPLFAASQAVEPTIHTLPEHILEIVSDSGEGAQKCGQSFGSVSAKMGNGAWTVEIIPAEIQPPPRSPAGASGVRIRIGTEAVTNWGNKTKLVIAFNEQVLLSRHRQDDLADDAVILLENMWEDHPDENIRQAWKDAMEEMSSKNYRITLCPLEKECLKIVDNPRRGKNMFALGLMSWIYNRDYDRVCGQIQHQFRHKPKEVYERNIELLDAGIKWAEEHMDFRIDVPTKVVTEDLVVMNGNTAMGMGAVASGLEMCSMYPITPATSVSHYLSEIYDDMGGIVHQAEDEIAAIGVAIGASYAGRVAFTVTSGPGMALKTEFLGLAVMTETPLVVVDVQRGGPSTGLPTKVEQSDLLSSMYGSPGDAPKVILAPATIEECFHIMITARKIAEVFRCTVIVLSDANLATGVTPFPRPVLDPDWQGTQPEILPVPKGTKAMQWDPDTGLSKRIIPGQVNGAYIATGLSHGEGSKVSYDPSVNQYSSTMRSRKLAVLQSTLQPPEVFGPENPDLMVIGWGSTKGAIEEACEKARAEGLSVSSTHLTFMSPLQPGIGDILKKAKKVLAVEINYSDEVGDPYITEENRRRSQMAVLLRSATLVDVDSWSRVLGQPLCPGEILEAIKTKLA